LVNKPQVSRRIVKWSLLILKYVNYKPNKIHAVADVLFRLPDVIEPLGIPYPIC
jgi:hypothetical protein